MGIEQLNLKRQSVVVASGLLADGTEITQEVSLNHDAGAPVPQIIGVAFKMINQLGGLMKDGPNETMLFYGFGAFPKGIQFEVKKVQLASKLLT